MLCIFFFVFICFFVFFFFNDTATTEIYTLSLHDALPISGGATANSLGQLAQTEIVDFLQKDLNSDFSVVRNGYINLKGYNNKGGMPFDIVVSRNNKEIGRAHV